MSHKAVHRAVPALSVRIAGSWRCGGVLRAPSVNPPRSGEERRGVASWHEDEDLLRE